jgi:hypothetical protein
VTIPNIYRSTDIGAPQLAGQVGSFIGVIDAILINGYGTGLNTKNPLQWTKEFSGTNKAIYKNRVADGATGFMLRVDDTLTTTTILRGCESATGVDTVSNTFPVVGQLPDANSQVWKSATANSTTRKWICIGTSKAFYFGVDISTATLTQYAWWFFGDFISDRPGDTGNCGIFSYNANNTVPSFGHGIGAQGFTFITDLASSIASQAHGYSARSYTGIPGSVNIMLMRLGGDQTPTAGCVYPNEVDNGLLFTQALIKETATYRVRGALPGLFISLHRNTELLATGQIEIPVNNVPGFPAHTFIQVNCSVGNGTQNHVLIFETTGNYWP